MTIEECIDILDDNFTVLNTHGHYTEKEETKAIEMAMASLEALEEIRQEAVDAIEDGLYVRNTRILDIIEKHIKDGDKQ